MEKFRFYLTEALKEWRILFFIVPILRICCHILWTFTLAFYAKRILKCVYKIIERAFRLAQNDVHDPFVEEYFPGYYRMLKEIIEKSPFDDTADSLKTKLSQLMETKQLYKNSNLTIDDISREMATNRTYLSKIIKRSFQSGFRDYLNRFRLEKAKELIRNAHSEDLNLLAVSENSGFQNYGTFNAAFKKEYGITPGEWKRRVMREKSR